MSAMSGQVCCDIHMPVMAMMALITALFMMSAKSVHNVFDLCHVCDIHDGQVKTKWVVSVKSNKALIIVVSLTSMMTLIYNVYRVSVIILFSMKDLMTAMSFHDGLILLCL
jgi:hypothetical protein